MEQHAAITMVNLVLNSMAFKHILYSLCLQLEGEISDLKGQKDKELAAKDTQLARLKKQMEASLTDNSR